MRKLLSRFKNQAGESVLFIVVGVVLVVCLIVWLLPHLH